jgi:hypothetical protein
MNSELLTTFAAAVRKAGEIPEDVRAAADQVVNVEGRTFDESYLAYLDEQIELAPRGPEWAARLERRREGLSAFCDRPLIVGRIGLNRDEYRIWVNPRTGTVIHWEEYIDVR